MHSTILAIHFLEFSRTAISMCSAGIVLFLIALWAAKSAYRRTPRPGQDRSPEQSVFRHPVGGFRRGASLGCAIHPARRAFVCAVAFVLGLLRRLCLGGRVAEHCHKDSGALVGPAVWDHDVSVCGDDGHPGSSRQPRKQVRMDASAPRNGVRRRRLAACGEPPSVGKAAGKEHAGSSLWAACSLGSPRYFMAWRLFCTRWVCPESRLKN